MTPDETIVVQDWMRWPETFQVMAALQDDGALPQALFVGGCVRNTLLDEAVEDIDIATLHVPEIVTERLEAAGVKVIPTGVDHGTVTAVIGERRFEVTALRKDVETDGRRAVVAYTEDWAEDAQRRDFTMNTLLMDLEGQVYDPTGQGLNDLAQKRVIFVGDAPQRIAEDYLRILRFFRFHALYGEGEPDLDALNACEEASQNIKTLSKERVTAEFFKLMSSAKPSEVLNLMFAHNVLKNFETKAYDPGFMAHVCMFQQVYGIEALSARLMCLAGMGLEHLNALKEFLLIPKVFIKDMYAISHVLKMPHLDDVQNVREAIYRHGRVPTAQALMIELAQDRIDNTDAKTGLDEVQNWDIPTFPISGEDLIAEGFKPGPELGEELARREEVWIEAGFKI